MQKSLKDYYSKKNDNESNSDSEIDELPGTSKDIRYYQQMLKKQAAAKEEAKILTKSGSTAECWKFFGHLYVSNKQVLPKYKFCKLCFDSETILKG